MLPSKKAPIPNSVGLHVWECFCYCGSERVWCRTRNPIDAVGIFVKGVVCPFVVYEKVGEDAESEADGETDDVDGGVDAMSGEVADRCFQIATE